MGRTQDDEKNFQSDLDVITSIKEKPVPKRPDMYRVLLLNDDYTPMDFVVYILEHFFQKHHDMAIQIMLHVHNYGVGECGKYSLEVAETKVAQVMNLASQLEHPLQCIMERNKDS